MHKASGEFNVNLKYVMNNTRIFYSKYVYLSKLSNNITDFMCVWSRSAMNVKYRYSLPFFDENFGIKVIFISIIYIKENDCFVSWTEFFASAI